MLQFLLIIILLVCRLHNPTNANSKKGGVCRSWQCDRFRKTYGEIHAKCKVFYPLQMNCSHRKFPMKSLRNVSSLDLSYNNLSRVPSEVIVHLKHLKILNLAANNIVEIEAGSFNGLRKLRYLNLSFNNLRKWTVDALSDEGALLSGIDVTGNKGWLPGKQLTHFKKLRIVRGVSWNEHCKKCLLVKVEANRSMPNVSCPEIQFLSMPSSWPWHDEINYGRALDFIGKSFWPNCLCAPGCFIHQYRLPLLRAQSEIVLGAMFCLYATGSVAMLLNIAVISFVVFHRQLRRNMAILMTCNIAVCDIFIGLFSVFYARFNFARIFVDALTDMLDGSFHNSDRLRNRRLWNSMGTMLTCSVTSQVGGCFILTLDKFLKIVFATKPQIRITRKFLLVFLVMFWSFSVMFALLPVFNIGNTTYFSSTMATPLPSDAFSVQDGQIQLRMGVAAGIQISLITVQLLTLILYLPIFVVAKRSSTSLGVKRETRTAKKIALLVISNFIIFTIPMVFGVFQDDLWHKVFVEAYPKWWQILSLTNICWVHFSLYAVPAICISMNSILNPLIYALRHPQFKRFLNRNSVSVAERAT